MPKASAQLTVCGTTLAASTSITGADIKVRGMAVDVVRAWAAKGYLIIYISSRPLVSRCMWQNDTLSDVEDEMTPFICKCGYLKLQWSSAEKDRCIALPFPSPSMRFKLLHFSALFPCAARVLAWMDRHQFPPGSSHFVGVNKSEAPATRKLEYLEELIKTSQIVIVAGVSCFCHSNMGLPPIRS